MGDLYVLRLVDALSSPEGKRLVLKYTDHKRPWYFTRHWTASFGFSKTDKKRIAEYIQLNEASRARIEPGEIRD